MVRAVTVTHNPIKPNPDGESWYRVDLELGQPQTARIVPLNRRRLPRPPSQPNPDACFRWYPSNAANPAGFNPATSALWDVDSFATVKALTRTADASLGSGSQSTSSAGGGGNNVRLGEHIIELNSAEAAVLAAGGAVIHGQYRARSRSGVGISESAQDNISQLVLRVFDSGGSLRGTAYAGHALASSAGSNKWKAQSTKVNREFPPAAASNTLTAVSGTVAGDFAVLEVGYKSFTVGTTGGSLAYTNDNADDLPEDELETLPE